MYHVSAQGVDEPMMKGHYYYSDSFILCVLSAQTETMGDGLSPSPNPQSQLCRLTIAL